MRAPLSPLTATIVVAFLAVACGSAASPAPVPTPSPSVPPTRTAAPATLSPTPIPWPSPAAVAENTAIAAGYQHTCAITDAGGVTCWGMSLDELSDGTSAVGSAPVNVPGLSSGVVAVAAGGSSTCALSTAGGVKCWGDNAYGQLGNGSTMDSSAPVDVVGLGSGVTAISVGWSHACALTNGGGVKCWGENHNGGLGDGTTTDSAVPIDVVGLASGISGVAAGGGHTCAMKSSGGVMCWGDGQSDDPDLFHTSVPAEVPGLPAGVSAIAASQDETCALSVGGDVRCWGPNYAPPPGETLPARIVAVNTSGVAGGVTGITLGESHRCLLRGIGGVACWGNDWYGQLGRGVTSDAFAPVPQEVSSLRGATGIAVGAMHTCARTRDGVACWGSNARGQLGSVMRCSSTSVPVIVSLDGAAATPAPGGEPTGVPIGRIAHATGPIDVLLRYDRGPDFGVSDLAGEQFSPGPEFTLYGDGTIIVRNPGVEFPPPDGPIVRANPFTIARLGDDQVQALLRFALAEGGLAGACDRYETQDTDVSESHILTIRAGGFEKRVDLGGPNPHGPLIARLFDVASEGGVLTQVWVPDRYVGNLLDASVFANIGEGTTPGLADFGTVPWPWPGVTPADFDGLAEFSSGRRVMSTDEASALGLSDNGGVVQRVYLRGPDGQTIYYFSLWPMSPDEAG